ncbi:hypothetical protein JXB02_04335 [Candidatus Woesearchaeota archaeon]|nr:hypothetical protein [Candidatus Woesearchaeota archaeon]
MRRTTHGGTGQNLLVAWALMNLLSLPLAFAFDGPGAAETSIVQEERSSAGGFSKVTPVDLLPFASPEPAHTPGTGVPYVLYMLYLIVIVALMIGLAYVKNGPIIMMVAGAALFIILAGTADAAELWVASPGGTQDCRSICSSASYNIFYGFECPNGIVCQFGTTTVTAAGDVSSCGEYRTNYVGCCCGSDSDTQIYSCSQNRAYFENAIMRIDMDHAFTCDALMQCPLQGGPPILPAASSASSNYYCASEDAGTNIDCEDVCLNLVGGSSVPSVSVSAACTNPDCTYWDGSRTYLTLNTTACGTGNMMTALEQCCCERDVMPCDPDNNLFCCNGNGPWIPGTYTVYHPDRSEAQLVPPAPVTATGIDRWDMIGNQDQCCGDDLGEWPWRDTATGEDYCCLAKEGYPNCGTCSDYIDNDGNGLEDDEDPACSRSAWLAEPAPGHPQELYLFNTTGGGCDVACLPYGGLSDLGCPVNGGTYFCQNSGGAYFADREDCFDVDELACCCMQPDGYTWSPLSGEVHCMMDVLSPGPYYQAFRHFLPKEFIENDFGLFGTYIFYPYHGLVGYMDPNSPATDMCVPTTAVTEIMMDNIPTPGLFVGGHGPTQIACTATGTYPFAWRTVCPTDTLSGMNPPPVNQTLPFTWTDPDYRNATGVLPGEMTFAYMESPWYLCTWTGGDITTAASTRLFVEEEYSPSLATNQYMLPAGNQTCCGNDPGEHLVNGSALFGEQALQACCQNDPPYRYIQEFNESAIGEYVSPLNWVVDADLRDCVYRGTNSVHRCYASDNNLTDGFSGGNITVSETDYACYNSQWVDMDTNQALCQIRGGTFQSSAWTGDYPNQHCCGDQSTEHPQVGSGVTACCSGVPPARCIQDNGSCGTCYVLDDNLCQAGEDFSTSPNDCGPLGWGYSHPSYTEPGSEYNVSLTTANVTSGTSALRIIFANTEDNDTFHLVQLLPLVSNQGYTISFDYTLYNFHGIISIYENATLHGLVFSGDQNGVSRQHAVVSFNATASGGNERPISIKFGPDGATPVSGRVYLDSVQLVAHDAPMDYLDQNYSAGCCYIDECWNGTGCVLASNRSGLAASQVWNASIPPVIFELDADGDPTTTGFRCSNYDAESPDPYAAYQLTAPATWRVSELKSGPRTNYAGWTGGGQPYSSIGWCPSNAMCLGNPGTILAANAQIGPLTDIHHLPNDDALTTGDLDNYVCINEGDWFDDFICLSENGQPAAYTTRTKEIALRLLGLVGNTAAENYTLFCGEGSRVAEYVAAYNLVGRYNTGEDSYRNPMCVLLHDGMVHGGISYTSIGAGFKSRIDSFNYFDLDVQGPSGSANQPCNTYLWAVTDGFLYCNEGSMPSAAVWSETPVGFIGVDHDLGASFFSTNGSLTSSDFGIMQQPSFLTLFWNAIRDAIRGLFGYQPAVSQIDPDVQEFLDSAEYHALMISRRGDASIKGMIENEFTGYTSEEFLVVRLDNFSSDICGYVENAFPTDSKCMQRGNSSYIVYLTDSSVLDNFTAIAAMPRINERTALPGNSQPNITRASVLGIPGNYVSGSANNGMIMLNLSQAKTYMTSMLMLVIEGQDGDGDSLTYNLSSSSGFSPVDPTSPIGAANDFITPPGGIGPLKFTATAFDGKLYSAPVALCLYESITYCNS